MQMSAIKGFPKAQYLLGFTLLTEAIENDSPKEDVQEAFDIMEDAFHRGAIEASSILVQTYFNGWHDSTTGEEVIPANKTKAVEILEAALSIGFPPALHFKGEVIMYGLYPNLTSEDWCKSSINYFTKAYSRGFVTQWAILAQKRLKISDYQGALILY